MNKEHRHDLYDNGCTICDALTSLEAHCNGTAVYPPWISTEANREACAVYDIRHILRLALPHYPTPEQVRMADYESGLHPWCQPFMLLGGR